MTWPALMLLAVMVAGDAGSTPAAAPSASALTPPINPHAQLREILDQPLYQRWKLRQESLDQSTARTGSTWLSQFLDNVGSSIRRAIEAVIDWLRKHVSMPNMPNIGANFDTLAAGLKIVAWVALATVVVFLLAVLYRVLRQYRGSRTRGRLLSRDQVRAALEQGHALALESPQWLEEASRLAEEGEFRAVYRALYLALLSGLHSAGRIDFRRTRTNWVYVQRFKGPDSDKRTFSQLTLMFDEVWYRLQTAGCADLQAVRQQVSSLIAAVEDREP